jgi:isopentenyl diphosphate isomerase/L-lactate dehydrogenase-like FMN-dependent dehydrogenase
MDGGDGAGIPDEDTGAVVVAGVSVPVDGTGGGGTPVDGTTGAEGAEVDMNADTRLLALALLRLYR